MTTLTTLLQDCRDLIGDTNSGAYIFTDQQVTEWINNALENLSMYFPRRIETYFTTSLNDRKYPLNSALHANLDFKFVSLVTVEYPDGQDPPQYLKYREYTHPQFWTQDGYYCFIKRNDGTIFIDEPDEFLDNPPELWISTKPTANQTIRLEAFVEHSAVADPSDECTVLPRHEHLIHMFVRWKAWSELAMAEGMDPDPTELLSATMEVNAGRAERSYQQALIDAQQAESDTGQAHLWMDKFDRIY